MNIRFATGMILLLAAFPLLVVSRSAGDGASGSVDPWAFIVTFAIAIGGGFAGLFWSMRSCQVRCPACNRVFQSVPDFRLLLCTRRCPRCLGEIVGIDSESIHPVNSELVSRPCYSLKWLRNQLPTAILALVSLVGSRLLFDVWRSQFEALLGEYSSPFVMPLLAIPGLLLGGWGAIRAWRRIEAKFESCPSCQDSYSSDLMELTGCCDSCGSIVRPDRVVRGDDVPIQGSLSRQEFCRASSRPKHAIGLPLVACWVVFTGALACSWIGEAVYWLSAAASFVLVVFEIIRMERHARSVSRPNCEAALGSTRRLVIASRRCDRCGAKVIRDHDAD